MSRSAIGKRPDRRLRGLLLAVATVAALGLLFKFLPGRGYIAELPTVAGETVVAEVASPAEPAVERPAAAPAARAERAVESPPAARAEPAIDPAQQPRAHAEQAREREIATRFEQAASMLHAKRYEYAIAALHRVLELAPRLVEAHVNMGYALLGQENHAAARDFFLTAIELRPQQTNAYYGLGVALEGAGDLEGALGAMRSYIHLSEPDDPYVRKARSALWEWQALQQERRETAAASVQTAPDPGAETSGAQ